MLGPIVSLLVSANSDNRRWFPQSLRWFDRTTLESKLQSAGLAEHKAFSALKSWLTVLILERFGGHLAPS
jgi:hypothetical protein